MTTGNSDDELLTLSQAATALRISRSAAYQQVQWGFLRAALINNRYMLRTSEVERSRTEGLGRRRARAPSWQAKEADRITLTRRP